MRRWRKLQTVTCDDRSTWMTLFATICANVAVQGSATSGFMDFDVHLVRGDFDLCEPIGSTTIHRTTTTRICLSSSTSSHNKQRFANVRVVTVESHLMGVAANYQMDIVLCKKRLQKTCVASSRLMMTNNDLPRRCGILEGLREPLSLCALLVLEPSHTFVRVCCCCPSTKALLADTTTSCTERGILNVGVQHEQFQAETIIISPVPVVRRWHLPSAIPQQIQGGAVKLCLHVGKTADAAIVVVTQNADPRHIQ